MRRRSGVWARSCNATALALGILLLPSAATADHLPRVAERAAEVATARSVTKSATDSLSQLLSEIERKLAPVREWRRITEAALRADSATPRADSIFLRMRAALGQTVYRVTRTFDDPDLQLLLWPDGSEAYRRRRLRNVPEMPADPVDVARADSVIAYLAERGIWVSRAEGDSYFDASEARLLDWLGRFLTPQLHAFLRFEAQQQAVPFAEDASLMISLDEVAQRLLAAEELLDRFPDSPAWPLITYTYNQLLAAYLGGLPNTGAFDWRTRILGTDFRRSHEEFLRLHGSTAAGKVVAEYVGLLKRSGFRRTAAVDAFLRARWDAVDSHAKIPETHRRR